MVQNWYRLRSYCLLPAMHTELGCYSVSSFSHIGKMTTFQTIKKIDELTNMIDIGEFPSLFLESPSAVTSIKYVCYLYEVNKSGSSLNELRHRIFPKRI